MLRHSDRGLMLIDLDKAYCDTLDATHGGTSGFSNPMKSDEKPTDRKDFAAIGKIFDYIVENTSHFPRRHFSRFRSECDNPDTTPEKLNAVLRPKSHSGLWAVVVFSLIMISGIGYYMYRNSLGDAGDAVSETEVKTESNDTVICEPQHIDIPDSHPVRHEGQRILINDFDRRMGKFTSETQAFIDYLSAGSVSDREIWDMNLNVMDNFTSSYNQLRTEYKKEYPEAAGIDVELALANAFENSRAFSLMQQFSQAARDTIVARHPESYMDVE